MTLFTIGRILVGFLYIYSALNDFYYKKLLFPRMQHLFPAPRFFYPLSLILMLIAGVMLIFNLWLPFACTYLILFLIIVTPLYHPLWKVEGETFMCNRLAWANNLAQIGALLILIHFA